ncbi:MAG: hypothetical protein LBL24_11825, partial [Bacteroidales bacterium]|nr:hypothetical protein [Bacteroidales bacterium]
YVSLCIPCAFPVGETISIEKGCAAGPKPRMGFHMNLLRRLVAAFRIDFYGYECPDGQRSNIPCVETRCIASLQRNLSGSTDLSGCK